MNVFELFAKLSLDSSEYEQGLNDAKESGSSFGSTLATTAKVGLTAIGAVGTAAVVLGDQFLDSASDLAVYGDNIDKMSQKIGISAEAYQEWDAVMQHCGASIDQLRPAMKTLATEAQTGNEAFQQLGISEEEVATLSQEDLFARVITGLQSMEEGTERTYIASQLLGRGATELGALLNTSAEDTQAMRDRVHELGGVMSDEAVKAAAGFQDQLQDMQTAFAGLKRGMMSNFLPSLTTVMSGLTEIFSGNYDDGINQITEGINEVITNISNALPALIEVGGSIIEALAEAIIVNLPNIMPALVDLVLNIANMIIENLPLLIETGLQMILQIALGIAEALPDLIPTIVDVVITIVETLIDNIDLLIDASVALIIGLAQGLINALPRLIEKVPEIVIKLVEAIIRLAPKLVEAALQLIVSLADGIIQFIPKALEAAGNVVAAIYDKITGLKDKLFEAAENIMNFFKDGILGFIDKAKTWGHDLIDNFIGGIKDKISAVIDTCKDIAGTIADYLGFSEPEKGPLSNFHTYAPDMMDLFAQGIKDNEKMLYNTIADAFDFQSTIASRTSIPAYAGANTEGNMTQGDMQPINLTIPVYIGQEHIDTIVLDAIDSNNYRTGGR